MHPTDPGEGCQGRERLFTRLDAVNVQCDGQVLLDFAAPDLLGLSFHPEVHEAARRAVDQSGLVGGTHAQWREGEAHAKLAEQLAEAGGRVLLFGSLEAGGCIEAAAVDAAGSWISTHPLFGGTGLPQTPVVATLAPLGVEGAWLGASAAAWPELVRAARDATASALPGYRAAAASAAIAAARREGLVARLGERTAALAAGLGRQPENGGWHFRLPARDAAHAGEIVETLAGDGYLIGIWSDDAAAIHVQASAAHESGEIAGFARRLVRLLS